MTVLDEAAGAVADAVETPKKVASHLHPGASYDLADHPRPTGLEEVWRFTPLKRLRGLLDLAPAGDGSDGHSVAHLDWQVDAPELVTVSTISTSEAIALDGPAPMDRIAASGRGQRRRSGQDRHSGRRPSSTGRCWSP